MVLTLALLPVLREILWAGFRTGEDSQGFKVDLDEATEELEDYLRRYAFDLFDPAGAISITRTTRSAVRRVLDRIDAGEVIVLSSALAILFSLERSQRIATTETTRLVNRGRLIAWDLGLVVERKRWYTQLDERVCSICGPMHGVTISIKNQFLLINGQQMGAPPAHPDCRCYVVDLKP